MGEEKPTNTSENEEHIYLDVIHIASRPPSKRSLFPTTNESPQKPVVENATSKEKSQKSRNAATCVLIATIIFLSAVCCALAALYVIEKQHSAMLASENRKDGTTPTPSTNCTTSVNSVPAGENLDCAVMESDLERRKSVYNKTCSKKPGEVEADNINTTPKKCVTEALQFQSFSGTVKSQGAVTMASATVCFWCQTSQGVLHHVTYIEPNHGEAFRIVEEKSSTQSSTGTNWHSFCRTWSTGEEFYQFYKDGQLLKHREIDRERWMRGGGTWVLGLQSDRPGGQTAGSEAKPEQYGKITSVNVWNRVLRRNELAEIMDNCASKYKGNVKSWQEFKSAVKRNVKLVKSTCCKT